MNAIKSDVMNALRTGDPLICPDCGAGVATKDSRCWICKRPFASDVPGTAELAGGASEQRATFQFGISSIMLIITLAAVILGVWQMAPGIGIALAVVAIPALIPTCIISMKKGARGRPLTPSEKFGVFAALAGVVMIVIIASGIAFFVTCLAAASSAGKRIIRRPDGIWLRRYRGNCGGHSTSLAFLA